MVIITHHVSMLYENTYYRSNATICHEESEEPIWARFSRPIFVAVAVLHFRKRDVRDVDGRAIVIESKEKYRSVEWVKWNRLTYNEVMQKNHSDSWEYFKNALRLRKVWNVSKT